MLRQSPLQEAPLCPERCHNKEARDDQKPHPGLRRLMQPDSETPAVVVVVVGFTMLVAQLFHNLSSWRAI
jgi:hypothetical protein